MAVKPRKTEPTLAELTAAYGATPSFSTDYLKPTIGRDFGQQSAGIVGRDTLQSEPVSYRDRLTDMLANAVGRSNARRAVDVLDMATPAGAAFLGNEAALALRKGKRGEAAVDLTLAALPIPGALKKGAKGALKVAEGAAKKALSSPLHEITLEYGADVARRLRGLVPADAPLGEWRAAAANLAGAGTPNNFAVARSPRVVRPADVATDPRIESRKGELGKIANLELGVTPRVMDPIPEVSLFDYEGYPYLTSMSDLAAAGDTLTSVNNVPFRQPFSRRGGQDYMFDNPGSVWASDKPVAEKHVAMAERLGQQTGKDVLYLPWTMGPNAVQFSHMPRGVQYSYADAALGGDTRKALASDIKDILPDWRSFEDPESADVFMKASGKARGELNKLLDRYRTQGGLGMGEATYASTDLSQMNTPLTTLRNVGVIEPRFGASPSSHSSYDYSVPGFGVGRLKEQGVGALALNPDLMQALGYKTPFDFPIGVQPGVSSPVRAMQMKPQGGILDEKTLRFLEELQKGNR